MTTTSSAPRPLLVLTLVAVAGSSGCQAPPRAGAVAAPGEIPSLLVASRIEIVEPFTRVRAFDSAETPNGIELLLQAVNPLDNPWNLVGQVRVELYEYAPASGDRKARRVEQWNVELTSDVQQQRKHWNSLTQMYEFRLGFDPARIDPGKRYVVTVTYDAPTGGRLTDECLIDPRSASSASFRPPTGRP